MRLAQVAAGALVAMAVLAGCSSKEPANDTLPSPAPTSAEPALPPLGPPDFPVPLEAREQSASGAKAFTTYYLDLSNHLLQSLDSQPLRDLSQGCEVCTQLADGYDDDRDAGYEYQGGTLSIRSSGEPTLTDDSAELAFVLDQAPVTVTDEYGTVLPDKTTDAYSLTGGISLLWNQARQTWLVTQLTAERQ